VDPAHQIHDFNPGIAENGLFWTIPLPENSVDVHFGKGTGSLHVSGLDVEDYHDIVNALQDGPSVEATVSFDIHWLGATDRFELRDTANRFAGHYVHTPATIAWAATESGIQFVSDPADTTVNELSLIGHEHNGVFFTGE